MSNHQGVKLDMDLNDIQGNILSGYDVGAATYLFYRLETVAQGRRWLATLLPEVTTATWQGGKKPDSMVNVAMSYQGTKALAVSPACLDTFPEVFRLGMAKRASVLGDFEESAPQKWEAPFDSPHLHVLVLVHGVNRLACDQKAKRVKDQTDNVGGATLLLEQKADLLPDGKEHFGFRDNISQPWIEGTNDLVGPPIIPGGGRRTVEGKWVPLKLGEFLLGHKDESGLMPASPVPDALGRNGTYLVLRKLSQDVPGFRSHLEMAAQQVFGEGSKESATRLAALMLGRWQSGCPVALSPDKDNSMLAADPEKVNDFTFQDDSAGAKCPLGAHIRRTNPRDTLDESGVNRHRIIRRGLPYGPAYNGDEKDRQGRGLMFIGLVADIGRQFEFLQRNYINNGEFLRLDRTDRDPLMGPNRDERDVPPSSPPGQAYQETPRKFTVPAGTRVPWAFNLPEFVTTKGGEYFFLPSMTTLTGLAEGRFCSFLTEYGTLESRISDPAHLAMARRELINRWLFERPKEMFDELRTQRPIFQMRGLGMVPTITIVTKYKDVLEVLQRNRAFSVRKYEEKMVPPRGPFILGMADSEQYQRELKILQEILPQDPTSRDIPTTIGRIVDALFDKMPERGRLDVIQDIAWPVPLRLNIEYFGLSGQDEPTLKRWFRDIYKDLFLNLRGIPEWTKAADAAVLELNAYLMRLITSGPGGNTVLARLIARRADLGLDGVRRNIFGLTVGVVETCLKAIARTIDQFLRRPKQLEEAQRAARDGEVQTVLDYAREIMRFNPQNHVLFRWCEEACIIAEGSDRATLIPKDSLVFPATLSAMFDPEVFPDPERFDRTRPKENYLFFGRALHECLGRYIGPVVLQAVLMRLLKLDNLQRANDDPFDPLDVLPEHFLVNYGRRG